MRPMIRLQVDQWAAALVDYKIVVSGSIYDHGGPAMQSKAAELNSRGAGGNKLYTKACISIMWCGNSKKFAERRCVLRCRRF